MINYLKRILSHKIFIVLYIFLSGLIIRVHPEAVIYSSIAWLSFIAGIVFLDGVYRFVCRGVPVRIDWGFYILVFSFAYNMWFHLVYLTDMGVI